jgi:hypothetical protein
MIATAHATRIAGRRLPAVFLLLLSLLAAPAATADVLDTVLQAMYTAGVIEKPVLDAKPLIACLAKGDSVAQCAAGSAKDSEMANDPQVQNVLDIVQSVKDQDWYGVLKKAGITVGCGLIPGGQVKDIACGELGKIASSILNGAGSVAGAIGGFIGSMFGSGEPEPMSEENYYTLNFMPWYHKSVIYQLDKDTPANEAVLNAPLGPCIDYFSGHRYDHKDAIKACTDLRTRLGNTGYAIGNAFRQETESYYQLHFAPKIDAWTQDHFADNNALNLVATQAMASCVQDERQKLPLPGPGWEQCQAMEQSVASYPPMFKDLGAQLVQQCKTIAAQRAVPANDDAYTRICKPMQNKVVFKLIFEMGTLKSQMDKAAAAGCPNGGNPRSILCLSYMEHANCLKAIPERGSLCHLDINRAIDAHAVQILELTSSQDQPCQRYGRRTIQCVHPVQVANCKQSLRAIGDAWGAESVQGIGCQSLDSPEYRQLMDQAQSAVAALNDTYPPNPPPTLGCAVQRDDPLVISCDAGYEFDAIPERSAAVQSLLASHNASGRPGPMFCPPDVDRDGAELPCLKASAESGLTPIRALPNPGILRPAAPARLRIISPVRAGGG